MLDASQKFHRFGLCPEVTDRDLEIRIRICPVCTYTMISISKSLEGRLRFGAGRLSVIEEYPDTITRHRPCGISLYMRPE